MPSTRREFLQQAALALPVVPFCLNRAMVPESKITTPPLSRAEQFRKELFDARAGFLKRCVDQAKVKDSSGKEASKFDDDQKRRLHEATKQICEHKIANSSDNGFGSEPHHFSNAESVNFTGPNSVEVVYQGYRKHLPLASTESTERNNPNPENLVAVQ